MGLKHTTYLIADTYHACYFVPGSDLLSSIGTSKTKSGAEQMAREANEVQRKQEIASLAAAIHPADRKIPKEFYQEN